MYFLLFFTTLFALFFDIFLNSAIPYQAHIGLLIIFFFIDKRESKKALVVAIFYGFFYDCLSQIAPFGTMIIFYALIWLILNQVTKIFCSESFIAKTIFIFLGSFVYSIILVMFKYASIYLFTGFDIGSRGSISFKYLIISSLITTLIAMVCIFFMKIGTKAFVKWFFIK
jgi:rod shape-determining protein MreD